MEAKFRHEHKYLCTDAELRILQTRLAGLLAPDPHTGEDGTYLIRSIYMDDHDNRIYYENEDGNDHREKWRIRSYGRDAGLISLECKQKESGMIRKTACRLTGEQYERILRGDDPAAMIRAENPPVLNRYLIQAGTRRFRPACIVQYRRRPFIYKNGNVRITFDQNIASGKDFRKFFDRDLPVRPILRSGQSLLEVKFDEYLPDAIYHAIQMKDMRMVTFSKYFLCRKYG